MVCAFTHDTGAFSMIHPCFVTRMCMYVMETRKLKLMERCVDV